MIGVAALVALSMQAQPPAAPPTTALERALVERACDVIARSAQPPPGFDHSTCVDDQMVSLRADFGLNLTKLTPADRNRLDRLCSPLEGPTTHEAYLDCVLGQLAPIREKLHRAKPDATESVAPAAAATPVPAPMPAQPAPPSRRMLYSAIGGSILVVALAAGVVVLVKKRKPATHACTSCGAPVEDAGAMCAACRHKVAEERRHAAAERAAEAADAERRRKEAEEAAAQEALRREEQAKQAAIDEDARRRELEEAAQRRQEEDAARPRAGDPTSSGGTVSDSAAPVAEEDLLDPHVILGVAKDATADAIRNAYEEAKTKYDPDNVSHLSPEVQQHYREKAEAVERAFQMLTQQS